MIISRGKKIKQNIKDPQAKLMMLTTSNHLTVGFTTINHLQLAQYLMIFALAAFPTPAMTGRTAAPLPPAGDTQSNQSPGTGEPRNGWTLQCF